MAPPFTALVRVPLSLKRVYYLTFFSAGLESHFIGGSTPKDIPAAMNLFSDQGLEVPMTELDIRIPVITGTDQPTNATVVKEQ